MGALFGASIIYVVGTMQIRLRSARLLEASSLDQRGTGLPLIGEQQLETSYFTME